MPTLERTPPAAHRPGNASPRPGAAHSLGSHASIRLATHGPAPVTLVITGELDLACADELTVQLCTTLEAYPQGITLDLASVSFCDCRALAAILTAQASARRLGRHFALGAHSPIVARLLELTGARSLLTSH